MINKLITPDSIYPLNVYYYIHIYAFMNLKVYLCLVSDSGNYSIDSAICAMLLTHMPNFPLYELSSMVFFFVPMVAIIILYAKMSITIHNSCKLTKKLNLSLFHKETQHIRARKGVIKMLSKCCFYKVQCN